MEDRIEVIIKDSDILPLPPEATEGLEKPNDKTRADSKRF